MTPRRAPRPPWILPRTRRTPDPQDRYRDPHPLAVLARRVSLQARLSAGRVAQRGTLSVIGLGCVVSSVWVAFGLAAGLAAAGVALVVTDWRIVP